MACLVRLRLAVNMVIVPGIVSEVVCDRAESLVHLCRCLYASLYNRFCKLDKLSNLVRRCVLVLKVSQLSAENVPIGRKHLPTLLI